MNFLQTLVKIESSPEFKDFKKEHSDAELVAGFFILDLLQGNNQRSLDYKLNDKIFTFSLSKDNKVSFREDKLIEDPKFPKLQKISANIKIDLDEIPSIAELVALDNNVRNRFQKIIAVLQAHEKQQIWNLTCLLDNLMILNILVDSDIGKILKFDRKSITDFIRKK